MGLLRTLSQFCNMLPVLFMDHLGMVTAGPPVSCGIIDNVIGY